LAYHEVTKITKITKNDFVQERFVFFVELREVGDRVKPSD